MFRKIASAFACAALTASVLAGTAPVARSAPVTIDPTSVDSVRQAYLTQYLPALDVPIGWTGDAATCDPGAPSPAAQDATFTAINFARALAGLPNATENTAAFAATQQAALMLHAKGTLNHTRDATWPCYTADGADTFPAGASGEIIATIAGAASVPLYIDDPGSSNRALGHRAQILHGSFASFASGSTSGYNVMHGYTGSIATPEYWSWPSAGYFPYQLAYDTAPDWSFYLKAGSTAAASVAVTKNGSPVSVSDVRQVSNGFGWVMPALGKPAADTPDVYHVTITGVTGAPQTQYDYDVRVFAIPIVALSGVYVVGDHNVGQTLTATIETLEPGATLSYQWGRAECTLGCTLPSTTYPHVKTPVDIPGATGTSYKLTAADLGSVVFLRITATKDGYITAHSGWMGVYSNGVGSKDLVQDKLAAKPGTVKIEGTTQVGWTLTATVTGTSPADAQLSYEWRRGSTAIPGATGSSYKLTAADAGQTISARVSASHPDYTAATSAWSTATAKIAALDEPTPTTAKVTLSKVSLKSLTVGKKAVTAKWAKVAAKQLATKYQVQYRVKGKKAWKSKTVAATKAALKVAKLTKGKAYQFRVRAVRVVKSGTLKGTYYGPWSAVKTSKKVK